MNSSKTQSNLNTSSPLLDLTYKRIFSIAWPVLIANLAMPLQSSIDLAVVGHFQNTASLAGLGIATQLWLLVLVSFNFLQYASSGLSAQAMGSIHANQSSPNELIYVLLRSLTIAVSLSVILWLFRPAIVQNGLHLLAAHENNKIQASDYLNIRYYGITFELMNYAFIGWFSGQGKTKQVMAVQFLISIINIVATLILVYQFNFGLEGVAIGTVIGYGIGCLLSLYLSYFHVNSLNTALPSCTHPSKSDSDSSHINLLIQSFHKIYNYKKLLRLFSLNKDIFIRTILLTLSFAWITRLSAQQGNLVMATNAILLQVLSISAFALDGVAVAAESLTGQALAHKQPTLLRLVVKRTGIVVFGLATILSMLWLVVMPHFIGAMTDLAEVHSLAMDYWIVAAILPIIGAGAYWLDGIMFGLTAGSMIRNVAIIVALIFFPITTLLNYKYGLSSAMPMIWCSVYLLLLLRCGVASITLWKNQKLLYTT